MRRNASSIKGPGWTRSFQQAAKASPDERNPIAPVASPARVCDRSGDVGSTHYWPDGATVGDWCLCGKRKRFTPDYQRPEFPGANFKAPRGSRVLEQEKADRQETADELVVKQAVRDRDKTCRCPIPHTCRGALEVIHLKDRSLGGAYVTSNLWLGCVWIHRHGPVSVHGKDIEIIPLTRRGMDGRCAWYLRTWSETRHGEFTRRCVARESAPGVVER